LPPGTKGLLGALYASPGVPADRVKVLRDAFAAMTKDEGFIKESEKMGLEIALTRGEEMNRDIEATMRDKRLMEMYKTITSVK
jgi:tripartite-type tricarboxylate transporter receptor subunit TctC